MVDEDVGSGFSSYGRPCSRICAGKFRLGSFSLKIVPIALPQGDGLSQEKPREVGGEAGVPDTDRSRETGIAGLSEGG